MQQSRLADGPVAPVITLFHPGEPSCDIWLEVGHLRKAGHAAWRVTAHHGHGCLAALGGERPRTVEETHQSVHAETITNAIERFSHGESRLGPVDSLA